MIWFLGCFFSFQWHKTSLNTEFTFRRWLKKEFPPKKTPRIIQTNPPTCDKAILNQNQKKFHNYFHRTVFKQEFHRNLGRECYCSLPQQSKIFLICAALSTWSFPYEIIWNYLEFIWNTTTLWCCFFVLVWFFFQEGNGNSCLQHQDGPSLGYSCFCWSVAGKKTSGLCHHSLKIDWTKGGRLSQCEKKTAPNLILNFHGFRAALDDIVEMKFPIFCADRTSSPGCWQRLRDRSRRGLCCPSFAVGIQREFLSCHWGASLASPSRWCCWWSE